MQTKLAQIGDDQQPLQSIEAPHRAGITSRDIVVLARDIDPNSSQGSKLLPISPFCRLEIGAKELWILTRKEIAFLPPVFRQRAADCFIGVPAYEYLLSVACGLESKKLGDRNALPMFKAMWSKFLEADKKRAAKLDPVMKNVLLDARAVRSKVNQSLNDTDRKLPPALLARSYVRSCALQYYISPSLTEKGAQARDGHANSDD
jgi:hypothetical protein